jgi:hypothetical protein
MKNIRIILLISIASLALQTKKLQAQSAAAAGKYMESINKELNDITTDMWDYTSAAAHGKSARKIENRRRDVLKSNLDAQKKIGKMSDFEGDKSLRDSVISFLKLSFNVLNNDFAKIVDMEEIAEQSYDAMEAYLLAEERASQKLNITSAMLNAQQQLFASSHGVTLSEGKDKIGQKLEAAGLVYKYYNVLYLIFFKSYKQEAYMIDAQNKGDINALKQNADALAKCSAAGMKTVDSIKPFKGDGSVKTECKNMLTYYKNESGKDAVILINYSVKKENFEKIKAAFESKPQNKRTQADVNGMNSAVNDFNKASTEYNKVNEDLNKKRTDGIAKWTDTVAKFIDKSVPKYK